MGMKQSVIDYFKNLQQTIIAGLEAHDTQAFIQDPWQKQGDLSGYGCTAILEGGQTFERAGVGFSCVSGKSLPVSASSHRAHLAGKPFQAVGVSLVLHPRNPYVPTVHMNVRCFYIADGLGLDSEGSEISENQGHYWFGGGMDLTPYYGFVEDCQHFHQTCKNALDPFSAIYNKNNIENNIENNKDYKNYYLDFKKQCDSYFYLKHRQEARGIGGIFFDDFNELGFEQSFELTKNVGNSFLEAYLPILKCRKDSIYSEKQREFQAIRRGRYVEFNLVLDRGTLFGLQSGGRTESILMSMPPNCGWRYQVSYPENSAEASLTRDFLPIRDWLNPAL